MRRLNKATKDKLIMLAVIIAIIVLIYLIYSIIDQAIFYLLNPSSNPQYAKGQPHDSLLQILMYVLTTLGLLLILFLLFKATILAGVKKILKYIGAGYQQFKILILRQINYDPSKNEKNKTNRLASENVKIEMAEKYPNDRTAYTDGKDAFITRCLAEAAAWARDKSNT